MISAAASGDPRARSHHFPPCSRPHRKFLHFLAELYGLSSESFDREPNRSVAVRIPSAAEKRIMVDDAESGDEVPRTPGKVFGVPAVGLKEAWTIWKKTGKLARFPEVVEEAIVEVSEEETGPPEETPNEGTELEVVKHMDNRDSQTTETASEVALVKEKRSRKKPANRIVEAPRPIVQSNVWDVLGEE
jgi:hypothetical protein